MSKQLVLNVFISGMGHHQAAWRVQGADLRTLSTATYYQQQAQIAERGKLHSVFLADEPGIDISQGMPRQEYLDPTVIANSILSATSRIGVIATASTTYNAPFTLARNYASIDAVSGGRVAWNVVTTGSASAAPNFGPNSGLNHADRYVRAEEFVRIVLGLWATWDDGAVQDGSSAKAVATDSVRTLDHKGEQFHVRGPMTLGRSAQGHPLLVQAGTSPAGVALAAKFADAVFTTGNDIETAREFYSRVKNVAAEFDRKPDEITMLPGLMFFIAETDEEARAIKARYDERIDWDEGLIHLSDIFGVPTAGFDLDGPLPGALPTAQESEGGKTRIDMLRKLADEQGLTVRGLLVVLANSRAHASFVGSYEGLANLMEEWFTTGACDGFNLLPAAFPDQLEAFVDYVAPILQQRGLFHENYVGVTLRENYGLPIPTAAQTRNRLAALT